MNQLTPDQIKKQESPGFSRGEESMNARGGVPDERGRDHNRLEARS